MLALALERVCVQMNLSIPGDISIIAFNNSLYAQLASPQLTAVDINSYSLGREAAIQILNHAEDPNLTAAKPLFPIPSWNEAAADVSMHKKIPAVLYKRTVGIY